MKKHGIKLFAGTAAVGILTLTAAFFAVRYFMVGNEYASCRRGMLTRSYEMMISLLAFLPGAAGSGDGREAYRSVPRICRFRGLGACGAEILR